jgi:hypothetical protein
MFVMGAEVAGAVGVTAGGGVVASVGGLATSARGTAVAGRSTGISGATVAVEKHLTGLRLVILVQLRLFQEHVGAHTHEGMGFGSEHRLDMAKLLVQAAEKV